MRNYLILVLLMAVVYSCSSKRDVIYMQDINSSSVYNQKMQEQLIRFGNILDISIKSKDPEALIPLNQPISSGNINQNRETLILKGYTVDIDGYIEYPEIGKIKVSGLTTNQVSSLISEKLTFFEILTDTYVNVKILNSNFTILGEVTKPGKYYFDEPNLNILQAIGMAGDLTINGVREEIKLIRNDNSRQIVYDIDLTSSDFILADSFQILSGDIIIVNPNTNRVKNAGIIGNSGTLLSLLSFLLSSIIIINR